MTYICCKDTLFKTPNQTAVGIIDFWFKCIKVLHINMLDLQIGVRNFMEFLELYIYNLENSVCVSTESMENTFKILTNN